MRTRVVATALLTSLGASGCFLGYDSRWGQQKRAQQNFVRQETPSALRGAPTPAKAELPRTARLRVYATRAYAAEVLDWPRRFATVVNDANSVIAPILGARLELEEAKSWPLKSDEDNVDRLAANLRELDSAEDVDWVIGLSSGTPRFESSFHELGVGELVGKHVVLRAINNAAEYQAIEDGLDELSAQERDKFRRERLAHKVTTVLLHELGHTLGALHEQDPKSIMNPAYSRATSAYSSAAVEVMRLVFGHRTARGGVEESAFQPLVASLRREPNPWVLRERDEFLRRFASPARAARPASSAAREPRAASPPSPEIAALSDAERSALKEAQLAKDARDFARAQGLAISLFKAYPANQAIQELRCQIATQRGLPWSEIEAECRDFMALQRRPPRAK